MPKRNQISSKNKDGPEMSTVQEGNSKSQIAIREMKRDEVARVAPLVARLKRLNGEFDPLLKTTDSLEEEARRVVENASSAPNSIVLVAIVGSKVVGVVKAEIKDRTFYDPRTEGAIDEFYILPEYRRGSLGRDLLSTMTEKLKSKGAELIKI